MVWDKLGQGRLEGKICVICSGLEKERKRGWSGWSAPELVVKCWGLGLEDMRERWISVVSLSDFLANVAQNKIFLSQ